MKWKDRYQDIKIGDSVELLKPNKACGDDFCCTSSGYNVGEIYQVLDIRKDTAWDAKKYIYRLSFGNCWHPDINVKKVSK